MKTLTARPTPVTAVGSQFSKQVTCRNEERVQFTRHLAGLLIAGIPLLTALLTLSKQSDDPKFQQVVATLADRISRGARLSQACSEFPRVFSDLYVAMIRVGEMGGAMDKALEQLALWLERDSRIRRRIRAALTYPCMVLGLSAFLTVTIFYCVVPEFVKIFQEMDIELPWMTKVLIGVTNVVTSPLGWMGGGALAAAGWIVLHGWLSTEAGYRQAYRVLTRVPVLSRLLQAAALARFSASMEALLRCGVQLVSSLKLSYVASGSPLLKEDAQRMVEQIMAGDTLSGQMALRRDLYPLTFANLACVGEESGRLEQTFERMAVFYDGEVDYLVETLGASLEPILLGSVSLIVGFIVISVLQPLYGYLATL